LFRIAIESGCFFQLNVVHCTVKSKEIYFSTTAQHITGCDNSILESHGLSGFSARVK